MVGAASGAELSVTAEEEVPSRLMEDVPSAEEFLGQDLQARDLYGGHAAIGEAGSEHLCVRSI